MIASDPATAAQGRSTGAGAFFCGAGLHKRFGGVQAVRDISLTVPRGGVFAIIGPNGAGKSTILEGIAWALYGTPAARGTRDSIRFNRAGARAQHALDGEEQQPHQHPPQRRRRHHRREAP